MISAIDDATRSCLSPEPAQQIPQNFPAIRDTIRAYTVYILRTFMNLAIAEVSKVELMFGGSVDVRTGVSSSKFKNFRA